MDRKYSFQKKVKRPADVFDACPQCETSQVLKFEGDVFCLKCSWDSVLLRADAQFSTRQPALRAANNEREPTEIYSTESTFSDLDTEIVA